LSHFETELDLNPKQSLLDELSAGLNEHAEHFVTAEGFQPIAFFARDDEGRLHGGIYGRINWNWLDVSLLWVCADHRGRGFGSELLRQLESEAASRGCTRSHVDTFSFQARDFYLANGYEKFAELSGYPEDHSRIYMKKAL